MLFRPFVLVAFSGFSYLKNNVAYILFHAFPKKIRWPLCTGRQQHPRSDCTFAQSELSFYRAVVSFWRKNAHITG